MAAEKIKVGLYIPNGDGNMSPVVHRWSDIIEMAQVAEETGFDSVWVADHMIFDFDGYPVEGRWECWTVLAGIAAATSRVEIGPLVSCMGFRNPALLAKMAETVDEISNGRLILALGAGWHEPEFVDFGFPFDHRVSRFEDGLKIVFDLIRNGETDFKGRWHQAPGATMHPRGPRMGRMPIIIGTDGERMLGLTARYADGWNTTWTRHPDETLERIAKVDEACRNAGRDPATISKSACVFLDLPGAVGIWSAGQTSTPNPMTPEETAERIRGYQSVGIDHVMLWLDPGTIDAVRAIKPALQLLAAEG